MASNYTPSIYSNNTRSSNVKDTNIDLMDIADFLFGAKSIERIIKGQGSWGDLINVGVTAATFLIPPAKLLKLPAAALKKVALASEKTAAVEGVSVAARRAAQTTADNANDILRRRELYTRTTPSSAAIAEQTGEVKIGKYSRTPDEEYDPFNRDILSPQEQVDDLIASENPNLKPDEYELAMRYDKRKFTQQEIEDRINKLTPEELHQLQGKTQRQVEDYVRKGEYTDKEIQQGIKELRKWNKTRGDAKAKETIDSYEIYIKSNLKVPKKLQKDMDELLKQQRGEKILERVNKELPEELPSVEMERSQALKDLYGDTYELAQKYEITSEGKMIPRTSPLTEEEILKFTREDALPQNPLEGLTVKAQDKVKRAGKLQAEMEKYENFNNALKANLKKYGDSKNPEFSNKRFNETSAKIKEQKDIIAKYQKEFNQIKLTPEERAASIQYAKTLRAESFAKRDVRRGTELPKIKTEQILSETKDLMRQRERRESGIKFVNKLNDEADLQKQLQKELNSIKQKLSPEDAKNLDNDLIKAKQWEAENKVKSPEELDVEWDIESFSKDLTLLVNKYKKRLPKSAQVDDIKPIDKSVSEIRPTEDEIFVFGSNLEGRHGAGAAKFARDNYGAEYGNPSGIQGQSYAIPTKNLKTNKGLELPEIKKNIDEFLNYAEANPDKKFFFSAIGTGLAGHSPQSIASLITRTPKNVRFDPKIGNLIKTKSTVNKVDDITIQSGGAAGADTVWAKEADKLGIKSIAHSFKEHSMQGTRPKLETRNVLTTEQLKEADVALKKANETLKRPTGKLTEYVRNLFRRNYYQVKDADAVIAIGKILPEGKLVDGGTGWAVQMGIDMGKEVYVYDQFVKTWARWGGNKFQKINGLPPKFNNFAGIGSRNLSKDGEIAIKEYLQMIAKGK